MAWPVCRLHRVRPSRIVPQGLVRWPGGWPVAGRAGSGGWLPRRPPAAAGGCRLRMRARRPLG